MQKGDAEHNRAQDREVNQVMAPDPGLQQFHAYRC